ncbi:MAG TPA: GNAT family N-acetyltransferase [Pyrinomonadaceae bacterium]|jgi:GNAT superfamily N-acetyltransferase|nr:GNAT family N-acetyltransferase [Pyrinomonadaceae bacterium]
MTVEASITLRTANEEDQDLLLDLYKSSRRDDLRGLGWDEDRIDEFLAMQYESHQKFLTNDHPAMQDQIVLLAGEPVGRLAVEQRAEEIRLIDITLLPAHRNEGTGTLLIRELQQQAATARRPLRLQIIRFNRAVALFERLGFTRTSETGTHLLFEWNARSN